MNNFNRNNEPDEISIFIEKVKILNPENIPIVVEPDLRERLDAYIREKVQEYFFSDEDTNTNQNPYIDPIKDTFLTEETFARLNEMVDSRPVLSEEEVAASIEKGKRKFLEDQAERKREQYLIAQVHETIEHEEQTGVWGDPSCFADRVEFDDSYEIYHRDNASVVGICGKDPFDDRCEVGTDVLFAAKGSQSETSSNTKKSIRPVKKKYTKKKRRQNLKLKGIREQQKQKKIHTKFKAANPNLYNNRLHDELRPPSSSKDAALIGGYTILKTVKDTIDPIVDYYENLENRKQALVKVVISEFRLQLNKYNGITNSIDKNNFIESVMKYKFKDHDGLITNSSYPPMWCLGGQFVSQVCNDKNHENKLNFLFLKGLITSLLESRKAFENFYDKNTGFLKKYITKEQYDFLKDLQVEYFRNQQGIDPTSLAKK